MGTESNGLPWPETCIYVAAFFVAQRKEHAQVCLLIIAREHKKVCA